MESLKIVICSHKRPARVTTQYLVKDCIIVIPESQYPEYKEANPNTEIVTHPDSVVGLPPKRQWIMDYFGDVFMLDDDLTEFKKVGFIHINCIIDIS